MTQISRRHFLALSGACSAALLAHPFRLAEAIASPKVTAQEAWGHFAQLSDGVWAVVSTPLESSDWTTGSNGGLVAGTDRVLAIEAFMQPQGAAWVAATAKQLVGQRPTDVLITHFHGDHANGLEGYAGDEGRPRVWMTETTRDLIIEADSERGQEIDPARREMLETASLVSPDRVTRIDLGGRSVELHPRKGHTPSDVTVEIADPSIVFFGDLLWNGFFPNYRDTLPTPFAASVRKARRERETVYVPGHGALANDDAVERLLLLIDSIEEAARRAFEQGVPAVDAAEAYSLPDPVADWTLFNPRYFEVAIGAWHRELGAPAATS